MEKIDNTRLTDAIKIMKEEKTKESQSIMLGEMMNSKFLNPTTLNVVPDKEGKINIPVGTKISFYTIVSTDKKKFAMAFTDNSELNKWYEANLKGGAAPEKLSKNSAVMGFMEYAEIILNEKSDLDGFVINPYNENIVFNKEQIASLKEQRINKEKYGITKNKINKDEEVGLQKLLPEEYPSQMIDELLIHMRNTEEINSAWILKMLKDGRESYLMVVDFQGDLNKILGEIARIAKPFLSSGITSLDMVPYNSSLGVEAIKNAEEFYNKNGLQLFSMNKNVEQSEVVKNAIIYINQFFEENCDGHDAYHSMRVYHLANKIAIQENADLELVRLASLLHDVDDRKLVGKQKVPFENAKKFLTQNNVSEEMIEKICKIISQVSFKGDDTKIPDTLEGKIVQDADRLDAIGAIGVARCLYYSGAHKIPLHNPNSEYRENMTEEEYYSNDSTAINHFYEKLLKLKNLMNTESAKKLAEDRHNYLESFLNRFLDEWNGVI